MQSRQVSNFKINKMTKAQYSGIVPSQDEVYITTDEADAVLSVNGVLPNAQGNVTLNIPSAVTESTVAGWGFTKNTGTVTSVNGVTPTNGNVALTIPTPNDGTLTITQDGNTLGTFTANQSGNSTIDIQAGGKDLYEYYSINADIIGSPTVEDCIVSDFSNSDYVQMRNAVNSTSFWEFQTKFTTGATIPTSAGEFQFITYGISGGGISVFLDGANPTFINYGIGNLSSGFDISLTANTTYIFKALVGFTDAYAYDGKTHVYVYNESGTLINSWSGTVSVTPQNLYMKYGTEGSNNFSGSIDFENTYINSIELSSATLTGTPTRVWTGVIPTIDTKADISYVDTELAIKADTDLNNVTDSAKVLMAGMGMPSETYTNLTLGANGATYTAPADGWVMVQIYPAPSGARLQIQSSDSTQYGFIFTSPANNSILRATVPVRKGGSYSVTFTSGTFHIHRFIYAVGSESEAS